MNKIEISDEAKKLYEEIHEYYLFLINAITREEYPLLQQEIGYEESYDEHIESLLSEIPSEEESLNHIQAFLETYPEFKKEEYLNILKTLNVKIKSKEQDVKHNAFMIMKENSEGFKAKSEAMKNKVFSVKIANDQISLPTFNNPLMTSLYSLLMTWFSLKFYNTLPELIN